jgi:hypothetical protein
VHVAAALHLQSIPKLGTLDIPRIHHTTPRSLSAVELQPDDQERVADIPCQLVSVGGCKTPESGIQIHSLRR